MTEPQNLSDTDVHAYVDGELDRRELAEIEAWLADHPADAARVHAYKHQRLQLHALYDLAKDAPLPRGVAEAVAQGAGLRRWLPGRGQIAAGILLLTLGVGGGWFGDDLFQPKPPAPGTGFVNRAINAYEVFAYEAARPVEVGVNDNTDYLAWLSERLGEQLRTPDLTAAGYYLIGGRLVNDQGTPAALFMYEDGKGGRVTLYVRRGTGGVDTDFRTIAQQRKTALYWSDNNLDYALAGEMPPGDVQKLKQALAQTIETKTAT